jgi:hypothetical protein
LYVCILYKNFEWKNKVRNLIDVLIIYSKAVLIHQKYFSSYVTMTLNQYIDTIEIENFI